MKARTKTAGLLNEENIEVGTIQRPIKVESLSIKSRLPSRNYSPARNRLAGYFSKSTDSVP